MRKSTMMAGTLALALLAGCAESTGPAGPAPGQGRVSLSIGTQQQPAPVVGARSPAADTVTLGGTTLVIDRVQLVIREIELKRVEDSVSCDSTAVGSDDDCEELEIGPLLVDLPVGGAPQRMLTVDIDTGTYRRVEFEIHKPEDATHGDSTFLQLNPGFRGVSIRVEGTFNGTPFVFTSDLDAEQKLAITPPLVVTEAGATGLALVLDLRSWFLNPSGTAYVDPATANKGGVNEGIVKDNIKNSFDVFEDD